VAFCTSRTTAHRDRVVARRARRRSRSLILCLYSASREPVWRLAGLAARVFDDRLPSYAEIERAPAKIERSRTVPRRDAGARGSRHKREVNEPWCREGERRSSCEDSLQRTSAWLPQSGNFGPAPRRRDRSTSRGGDRGPRAANFQITIRSRATMIFPLNVLAAAARQVSSVRLSIAGVR